MKKLILIFLITLPVAAMAEPKRLICKSSAEIESERLRKVAEEYRDPNYVAYNVESAKEFDKFAKQCVGADYGRQNTFVFDTDGLKNSTSSSVEVSQMLLCGRLSGDVVKGALEATPNIITIKFMRSSGFSGFRSFNIDRKTLVGGYDTERDFTCELLDIDTSQNLL